jgi:hypothetical protein
MGRPWESEDGRLRRWDTEEQRQELHRRSLENIRKRRRMERASVLPPEMAHLDVSDIPPGSGEPFRCRAELRRLAHVEAIIKVFDKPPKWVSYRHLREDIDRAVTRHRVSAVIHERWVAKREELREACRVVSEAARVLSRGSLALPCPEEDGRRGKPFIVTHLEDVGSFLSHRLADEEGRLADEDVRALLGSPLEGLVGDLEGVYERRFQRDASASGGSHGVVVGAEKTYDRPRSEFERFVLAVCAETGIEIAPSSIPALLARARRNRVD